MPRTSLSRTSLPGAYAADGVALVETPADTDNLNSLALLGGEIVIARNIHPSAALTVTINSVANSKGRVKDITADSLAAGVAHAYGPFLPAGWKQSDGTLHLEAEGDSEVTFTVTIASPGVLTKTTHGFTGDEAIVLHTTGALPTGLSTGTIYYVQVIDPDTFTLALTKGGADINTSGSQSGVHKYSLAGIVFSVLK